MSNNFHNKGELMNQEDEKPKETKQEEEQAIPNDFQTTLLKFGKTLSSVAASHYDEKKKKWKRKKKN